MFRHFITATLFLIHFTPTFTFANPAIEAVFRDHFENEYIPNKCGQNIENFVRALDAEGLLPASAKIVKLDDEYGGSMFGMLNAEYARNATTRGPGETNWYHHVVAEIDGKIYDFDFGNQPEIITTREWLDRQWLQENENPYPAFYRVGRKAKLKYNVQFFDAARYLSSRLQSESLIRKISLAEWYEASP
jgi:hypothetical protein